LPGVVLDREEISVDKIVNYGIEQEAARRGKEHLKNAGWPRALTVETTACRYHVNRTS
jgi:hypothetical protein